MTDASTLTALEGAQDDEIVDGYRDGFRDTRIELPASLANRSAFYRFGWENGRDDRVRKPRATAAVLRERLALLRAMEK